MSSSSDLRARPARIVRPHAGAAPLSGRPAVARAAFDNELVLPPSVESVLLEESWKNGFARGIDEGIARGLAMAAAETAADERRAAGLREAIAAAAAEVVTAQHTAMVDAEEALLHTAFALAEAIIGSEAVARPRRGQEALRMALQLTPQRATVVARLNPADVEDLGDVSALTENGAVTVVADASVLCGDCIIDMPNSRIEVVLRDAIERARTILFGGRANALDALSNPVDVQVHS